MKTRPRKLIYDTLNEYNEGIICQDLASLALAWSKVGKEFCLVYQPINPIEDFDVICDLVFSSGDICFCIEEIDTFLSLNPAGLSRNFLNIVQRGRHNNIDLVGITQRPFTMPAILRSQCKELYTFRQFEQRDIEWLRGILGDAAEDVRNLKQYEFIAYAGGKIFKSKTKKGGFLGNTDTTTVEETRAPLSEVPPQQREDILPPGDSNGGQEINMPGV